MGDFPAVRQLVAQAVSPVLAGAPSPAPAPPLYPLPLDAARIAATTAAAGPRRSSSAAIASDFLKNTLKVLHGLKITLAEKQTCDPSNTLDPENRTNRPETERVLPVLPY